MNITAQQLIDLIKASPKYNGTDVHVSLKELIAITQCEDIKSLIVALMDMKDVQIADKGLIIPNSYFE